MRRKKFFLSFIATIMVIMVTITGCGKKDEEPVSTTSELPTTTDLQSGVIDNRQNKVASFSESEFSTEGFLYTSGQTAEYYVFVTNNSQATVSVNGNATAQDNSGNTMGLSSASIDVLGPNETSVMEFSFRDIDTPKSVDYSLSYEVSKYYKPVISNLTISQHLNENNVTLLVKNNGEYTAGFVQAYVLFCDASGNVVDRKWTYVTNNSSCINPGETIAVQFDCSDTYNSVIVGLKGRSDGNSADTTKQADASVLVTKELKYDSGFNTIYYIPAYNTSDTALSVWANAIAKDSANNVIGASSMSIEVLGPKETSIGQFSFHNIGEVDHIEYTLNASVASYFCPVVKHLEVEPSLYNNNLMVSITNHGSVAAEFVQAYALIENQDGEVIGSEWTYIIDGNSQIAPGATESEQFNIKQPFDHIDIYLVARGEGSNNTAEFECNDIMRVTKDGTAQISIDYEQYNSAPIKQSTTESEPEETKSPSTPVGLRNEFKAAMDAYESFFDEYCEFMEAYKENPTNLSLLSNYADMLVKLDDVQKKFDAWKDSDLNSVEMKYYLEVSARIEKKLLDLV